MKQRTSFVCQQCGNESASWFGRCPSCGEWNSLVETTRVTGKPGDISRQSASWRISREGIKPLKLTQIKHIAKNRLKTGFNEFDLVLGGGIVTGSVILISGDPGVGKSTLLLAVAGKIGAFYVSGEESQEQIKLRAERLGIKNEQLIILSDTIIENILDSFTKLETKPAFLIIDSIQTMVSDNLDGTAGSVGQVRYVTQLLIQFAKQHQVPIMIVGHVTKEGTIAGPKLLEHMVDVVCYFEGEKYSNARILRSLKNRFGPTDETGIFEMVEDGIQEVANPSKLFLSDKKETSGSAIGVTLEGTRPLLVEIQALIVSTQLPMPRRVVNGIDYNRLQMILAILQKRLSLPFDRFDVFVTLSGGLVVKEPAIDLPVALALISACKNKPLPKNCVSFGELDLLGSLRLVRQAEKRTKEAKKLGFTNIISCAKYPNLFSINKNYF